MVGKHVLSSSALMDQEHGDGDRVLEKTRGQRPGFQRTHAAWVQIVDLHFLSCVALDAVFHLSEPPF